MERGGWDPRGWNWNGITHHGLNFIEDACFAADVASIGMACTGIGIPEAGVTAAGSFLGKNIVRLSRHLLPKSVTSKLTRIPFVARVGVTEACTGYDILKVGKYAYSNTTAKHAIEFVKRGPNAGRLSRPYMKSPSTINEIMAAGKPIRDPGRIPGGLRWDVPGTFRGNEGIWELVVHPETNIIYHYNFR